MAGKLKLVIAGCLMLFAVAQLYAQHTPMALTDRFALKGVPDSVSRAPAAYALYLTRPFTDTVQKVRALYTWMAANIRYDFDRYYSDNFIYPADSSIADMAFYSRKAVCAGYSALFARFCAAAGIECTTISGYARGFSSRANEPVAEVNHDWNAVKINGRWQLMDVTWARDTSFQNGLDTCWFLPSPRQFALTHHPVNPQWQLLPQPVSKERFNRLPHFYSRWLGMGFYDHSTDVVTPDAVGRFEVTVKNDGYYDVRAILQPEAGSLAAITEPIEANIRKKKNEYRIYGRVPLRGRWKLTVYAGKLLAPRSPFAYTSQYWGIAGFLIHRQ